MSQYLFSQPPTLQSRPPAGRPRKSVDDLPVDEIAGMAGRLFMLMSLAWDYVETVQQIAKVLRASETKPASRRVNELHRIYDQRRSYSLSGYEVNAEKEVALIFEEVCSGHMRKLHRALCNEHPDLSKDWLDLVEAVDTALTVLMAAILYGKECDATLRSQGVCGHSIITAEILELAQLLPIFAGDCYMKDSPARTLTTRILLNEVKRIDLIDENGNEL